MANTKTTYLKNAELNHVLRNISYASPSTVYLALLTQDPTVAGTVNEASGGSYARSAIAFDAASNGQCMNTSDIVFTNMPGVVITHIGIMDAATGGNMLRYKELPSPVEVSTGNELTFLAGSIIVDEG